MPKKMFKWLCVEAIEATDDEGKGLGHVKWLVTDRGGVYVGCKLRQLPEDERRDLDNTERFEPRKHVRRESLELMRAIQRGMLVVHYPKGVDPKKGGKAAAIAPDVKAAFEAFGVPTGTDVGGGHPSQSSRQRADQRRRKKASPVAKKSKAKAKAKKTTTKPGSGNNEG